MRTTVQSAEFGVRSGIKYFLFALPVFLICIGTAPGLTNWQWIDSSRIERMAREGTAFLLIDVRSAGAFEDMHIEGALNIPGQDLRHRTFPMQRLIVLVDDALGQKDGREAAEELASKGLERVFVLTGGIPEWKRRGLTLVETKAVVRGVTTANLAWAQAAGVELKIYDLRDTAARKQGIMQSGEVLEGATLEERLTHLRGKLLKDEPSSLAARLKPAVPVLLVFAAADAAEEHTRRLVRGIARDVRYLIGGYEATRSDFTKAPHVVGACPTCPGKGK